MKKIIVGLVVAIFLMCSGQAMASSYSYSGAWAPNSDDIFGITLTVPTPPTPGWTLGIYDYGNLAGGELPFLFNAPNMMQTIYFTEDVTGGSGWYASAMPGATGPGALSLGLTTDFGFVFRQPGSPAFLSYDVQMTGPDSYILNSLPPGVPGGMSVALHDANPVPIPGAVWLLGSGLLGLVGIRRKKRS